MHRRKRELERLQVKELMQKIDNLIPADGPQAPKAGNGERGGRARPKSQQHVLANAVDYISKLRAASKDSCKSDNKPPNLVKAPSAPTCELEQSSAKAPAACPQAMIQQEAMLSARSMLVIELDLQEVQTGTGPGMQPRPHVREKIHVLGSGAREFFKFSPWNELEGISLSCLLHYRDAESLQEICKNAVQGTWPLDHMRADEPVTLRLLYFYRKPRFRHTPGDMLGSSSGRVRSSSSELRSSSSSNGSVVRDWLGELSAMDWTRAYGSDPLLSFAHSSTGNSQREATLWGGLRSTSSTGRVGSTLGDPAGYCVEFVSFKFQV
jgi:hypothetical protein